MRRLWRSFKQRLRLDAIAGCCGGCGGCGRRRQQHPRDSTPTILDDVDDILVEEEEEEEEEEEIAGPDFRCILIREAEDRIDLATALAAERQLRASTSTSSTGPMRLPEGPGREKLIENRDANLYDQAAADDDDDDEGDGGGDAGGWGWCCVCMEGRRKRAAFIPCGHAFCRRCARELWVGRGACPLCNRAILDVLRIF